MSSSLGTVCVISVGAQNNFIKFYMLPKFDGRAKRRGRREKGGKGKTKERQFDKVA